MFLLLDIDGVMVPGNSWRRPEFLEDGFPDFSSRAITALRKLMSLTGAKIILTTSHKHKFSISEWEGIFKRRNIEVDHISRLPENRNYSSRKDEIITWFKTNKVNDFLIIDDDKSLNELPASLKEKLLQTSASVGLTEYLVDEALENILNHQHELA